MTISRLTKIIAALVVMGAATTLFTSEYALSVLKVGGPIYERIVMGKDLVADILPPPAYLIEAYLEATLALDSQTNRGGAEPLRADLDRHSGQLKKLHDDYLERHTFWKDQPLPANLQTAFLQDSQAPGIRFWSLVGDQFLPALHAGDTAKARAIYSDISKAYTEHRAAVDKTVTMANDMNTRSEYDAARQEMIYTALVWGVGLLVLALVIAGAAGVLFGVVGAMDKIKLAMNELVRGRLDLEVANTARRDEIGEMASAVAVFREHAIERGRLNASIQETREKELMRQAALDKALLVFKDSISRNLQFLLTETDGLRDASHSLLSASGQANSEAEKSSLACAEAASSANAVAAATEELNASIREIAGQAHHTSSIVGETTQKAQSTDEEVSKLTEAVTKIELRDHPHPHDRAADQSARAQRDHRIRARR